MDDDRTLSGRAMRFLDRAADSALPLRRMAKLGLDAQAQRIMHREKDPAYRAAMAAADAAAESNAYEMRQAHKNALRRAVGKSAAPIPQYDWSDRLRDLEPFDGSGVKPVDGFKKGGKTSKKAKVSPSSKRGDGIAQRGKTRGRIV